MNAIFDFAPKQCPNCGHKFRIDDPLARNDYFAGCAQSCLECGFHFQYVGTKIILANAKDLKYYADRGL